MESRDRIGSKINFGKFDIRHSRHGDGGGEEQERSLGSFRSALHVVSPSLLSENRDSVDRLGSSVRLTRISHSWKLHLMAITFALNSMTPSQAVPASLSVCIPCIFVNVNGNLGNLVLSSLQRFPSGYVRFRVERFRDFKKFENDSQDGGMSEGRNRVCDAHFRAYFVRVQREKWFNCKRRLGAAASSNYTESVMCNSGCGLSGRPFSVTVASCG